MRDAWCSHIVTHFSQEKVYDVNTECSEYMWPLFVYNRSEIHWMLSICYLYFSVSEFLIDPPKSTAEIYEVLREPMKGLVDAWCNEITLVYGSRCFVQADQGKLYDVIHDEMTKQFNSGLNTLEESSNEGRYP